MNNGTKIKRKRNPQHNVNPLSKIIFLYTLPTFIKGYKKSFEEDDLPATLTEYHSKILGDKLEILWNAELDKADEENRRPSLGKVIISAFASQYITLGLLLLITELVLKPAQAVFLGRLLLYYMPVMDINSHTTQLEARCYAGGIVLLSFLRLLLSNSFVLNTQLLGLKVKISCCSLIYRKALKLNNGAFSKTSVGQMINMISNDVSIFLRCGIMSQYIWVGPMACILVVYLMYMEVGFSSIIGVLLLLCFVPVHFLLGKAVSKFRSKAALHTDERVRYMNEIILGIKIIKMYAWEKFATNVLFPIRNLEMKYIRLSLYVKAAYNSFDILIIPIVFYVTMIVHLLYNDIRADKVFTLTIFYNSLRVTMATVLPQALGVVAETLVSIKRINDFLLNSEIRSESIAGTKDSTAIRIICGSAQWEADLTLKDINLTVKRGSLAAIIGQVGCGKSSLINVILNELHLCSGKMYINRNISYASQDAWLFGGSVRDNILFGEEMNFARYNEVIRVCALETDFNLLPFSDQTLVGGRGTSLSGGQKARINLARAVYRDADVYLLDEPLAAVDARVGKEIFENCIKGFLKGKTVILATHQLKYLTNVDEVITIRNGTITSQGKVDENELVEYCKDKDETDDVNHSIEYNFEDKDNTQQIVKEQKSVGTVSKRVYKKYLTSTGKFNFIVVVLLTLLTQVLISGGSYFLTYWVNMAQMEETYAKNNSLTIEYNHTSKSVYIYTYSIIMVMSVIVACLRSFASYSLSLRSSRKLHNDMFNNVISGTMYFFNTNSQGRIINRFSQDIGTVDTQLPSVATDTAQLLLSSLGSILLVAIVNYWLLVPTFIIGTVFFCLKKFCLLTSRDVKRLEGVTRSYVFEHISSSLQGLSTIRAFQAETLLTEEFDAHQDLHSCCYHLFLTASQGFGFCLDGLCTIYISIVTLSFAFSGDETLLGGNIGLAITQSLLLMGALQWGIQQTAEFENNMTSVERIFEYDSIEQEDYSGADVNKTWPEHGEIVFRDVSLKYSSDGPLILKCLSFKISPGAKIGIIGRTGAGKSSIVNALLRLSYTSGDILIDNVDIRDLNLQALRSRISVIPQDPTLFSGTLRKNLDPFEEYEDKDLWNVLKEVELKDFFASLPQGLCHSINQGGTNVSVGQRQLICLARAILRNNKILVMDEATANVDTETDALLQRTIREKFKYCTVITIAHRLETIIDCDEVLVMSEGEVVEFDKPSVLLQNNNGYLYNIVKATCKNENFIS